MQNPPSKDIDIKTQQGLDLLKIKAKYYGHYADQLLVLKLIEEIELLRANNSESIEAVFNATSERLGW